MMHTQFSTDCDKKLGVKNEYCTLLSAKFYYTAESWEKLGKKEKRAPNQEKNGILSKVSKKNQKLI